MEVRLLGRDYEVVGAVEARRLDLHGLDVEMVISRGGEAAAGKPNEDALLVMDSAGGEAPVLGMVADAHFGREAAELAVAAVAQAYSSCRWPARPQDGARETLLRFVRAAQAAIVESGTESETTLLVGVVDARTFHWASVGDSYVYVLRPGRRATVANPQVRVWLGARLGVPVSEVTRHGHCPLEVGTRVLMTTDGIPEAIWNVPTLGPKQIAGVLDGAEDHPLRALTQRALAQGGEDNIAAVLLTVPGSGTRQEGTERRRLFGWL
jgi:serine/threonine protein phosphatase PrpC